MIVTPLILAMLVVPGTEGCVPASSRAFTGSELDAPFFVLDGGSKGPGLGQYDGPTAMAILEASGQRSLAVTDTLNHRIKVMTHLGFFQDYWGGLGSEPGRFTAPTGIAVTPAGDVWVADARNHQIQKLSVLREHIGSPTGRHLAHFGRQGAQPGQLDSPAGLATTGDGGLLVADTNNHRIQKFDAHGKFLRSWGTRGTGPGQLDRPMAVAVDGKGNIYAADTGNHRIQKFDSRGRFLLQWGSRGSGPGQLDAPQGLAVDRAGLVYVADTANHRIQKFDAQGKFLASVGCPGSGEGELRYPAAIVLDAEQYLYVLDAGNHRVQKLGPQ